MGAGCLLHISMHDTFSTLQVTAETPWSQNSSRKSRSKASGDCHNFFACRIPFPSRKAVLSAFLPSSSFPLQLPEMQSSCVETLSPLRDWASLALGLRTERSTTLGGSLGIPGVPLQAWAKERAPTALQALHSSHRMPTVTSWQLCRDNQEGATAKAWERKG